MSKDLTVDECRKIIFNIGIKHGVSPRLISERLLSAEDKQDMRRGLIASDSLDAAVKIWKDFGMRNYADGSGDTYVA